MSGLLASRQRLLALSDVVLREVARLRQTDARLFTRPFDEARIASLEADFDLAERVDAFVARFGRLQDTVGDKLLPRLLGELAEPVGAAIDNLARAERLGWLQDVEQWLAMRRLRNLMVHEYVGKPAELAEALAAGHGFVPQLCATAEALVAETRRRCAPA